MPPARCAACECVAPGRYKILAVDESPLKALVEEQLGSVVFVMDYIQLDFSSARITAYVWPTVTLGDATLHFGDRRDWS